MQPCAESLPRFLEDSHAGAVAEGDRREIEVDGLTVDAGDWWFNLRPSNTEPLLRLNLEAATPDECSARVAEVLAHFS